MHRVDEEERSFDVELGDRLDNEARKTELAAEKEEPE